MKNGFSLDIFRSDLWVNVATLKQRSDGFRKTYCWIAHSLYVGCLSHFIYSYFCTVVDYRPSMFKDKSGKISSEELRTICEQLKIPVEEDLLNSLISYCDADGDKLIDYEEFCKFLNWQNVWQDELIYHQQTSQEVSWMLRPFSIAVVLPARVERTCFNFCCRCLIWAFSVSAFVRADTLESWTTFNFLGVPARLIFHEIKIGLSAREGKETAMENGL